jgi:hypothetical protein
MVGNNNDKTKHSILTTAKYKEVRQSLVWCPGQNKRIASLPFLTELPPEINCNQVAIELTQVTSVFFVAKTF